jgi:sarcosine oxidase
MNQNNFDVVVIGVGSMGSAACWFLANRGYKVLGLEQFSIVHENGSHTGQSRITRKAYFEHSDYVPLLQRSFENWHYLENETGKTVYYPTGMLYTGHQESEVLKGVMRSARLHNLEVVEASIEEAREQFPALLLPDSFKVLFEPDAGFLTPERVVMTYAEDAVNKGAVINDNEKVVSWEREKNVITVVTTLQTYTCERLILTAGSWTSKVLPTLATTLKVTKQILAWVKPAYRQQFEIGNFPCWFIDDPQRGTYYGFPVLPEKDFGRPSGFKIAHHVKGEITDPDMLDHSITKGTEEDIFYALTRYFPGAIGEIVSLKRCLYTSTPDDNFIIDHVPGHDKKVIVACGFSGHGFKFVSVVGEILADLAMEGKTDLPIGFLSMKRFAGTDK